MEARRVPGQGEFAGRRPACGLLPTGAALWVDRKLSHAADAIGVSDGGGPAAKQVRKPLRRLTTLVVEGADALADPAPSTTSLTPDASIVSPRGDAPSAPGCQRKRWP